MKKEKKKRKTRSVKVSLTPVPLFGLEKVLLTFK